MKKRAIFSAIFLFVFVITIPQGGCQAMADYTALDKETENLRQGLYDLGVSEAYYYLQDSCGCGCYIVEGDTPDTTAGIIDTLLKSGVAVTFYKTSLAGDFLITSPESIKYSETDPVKNTPTWRFCFGDPGLG